MGTMIIAAALLLQLQPADSVTVGGVVVDPAGKPVTLVAPIDEHRREIWLRSGVPVEKPRFR